MIIDTRSTVGHARQILDDLRRLTAQPVAAVINTHHHFDHTYGNHAVPAGAGLGPRPLRRPDPAHG